MHVPDDVYDAVGVLLRWLRTADGRNARFKRWHELLGVFAGCMADAHLDDEKPAARADKPAARRPRKGRYTDDWQTAEAPLRKYYETGSPVSPKLQRSEGG